MFQLKDKPLIISDEADIEERVTAMTGLSFDVTTDLENCDVIYITSNGLSSRNLSKDAKYAWIDTGQCKDNSPVYISLKGNGTTFGGGYVGTAPYLLRTKHMNGMSEENVARLLTKLAHKLEPVTTKPTARDDITDSVSSLLLLNYWSSKEGLSRYIKTVGGRIMDILEMPNMSNYYLKNSLEDVIVNTGLLNKYGTTICLMYRPNKAASTYTVHQLIDSKKTLIEAGFPMSSNLQLLKPISFLSEKDNLNELTADCFDLSIQGFDHIIERYDRMPSNIREMGDERLAIALNDAIQRALNIWICDHNYARPCYNGKTRRIAWYLPLHIGADLCSEPEVVAVFSKDMELGLYSLKTILPFDSEIKDRVLALNLYNPWRWE